MAVGREPPFQRSETTVKISPFELERWQSIWEHRSRVECRRKRRRAAERGGATRRRGAAWVERPSADLSPDQRQRTAAGAYRSAVSRRACGERAGYLWMRGSEFPGHMVLAGARRRDRLYPAQLPSDRRAGPGLRCDGQGLVVARRDAMAARPRRTARADQRSNACDRRVQSEQPDGCSAFAASRRGRLCRRRAIIGAGQKPNGWAGIWRVRFTPTVDVVDAADAPVRLEGAHPNPFRTQTTIRYTLTQSTAARLNVFDAAGRHVRRLLDGVAKGPGDHVVRWDGTDDMGRRTASGVYFVRVPGSATEGQKVVLGP